MQEKYGDNKASISARSWKSREGVFAIDFPFELSFVAPFSHFCIFEATNKVFLRTKPTLWLRTCLQMLIYEEKCLINNHPILHISHSGGGESLIPQSRGDNECVQNPEHIVLINITGCWVQLQPHQSPVVFKALAQYKNLNSETHHLHPKRGISGEKRCPRSGFVALREKN